MSLAERVYRVLLRTYPASFRREYQESMEQAFRDQRRDASRLLWARTLLDIFRSAPPMHMTTRNFSLMGAWLFGLAAALFLGRMELHTDDTGIEVGSILLFTFVFGFWDPKRAWLASLLGLSAPVAELLFGHATGLPLIAAFVFAMGLIGSGSGLLLRKSLA